MQQRVKLGTSAPSSRMLKQEVDSILEKAQESCCEPLKDAPLVADSVVASGTSARPRKRVFDTASDRSVARRVACLEAPPRSRTSTTSSDDTLTALQPQEVEGLHRR